MVNLYLNSPKISKLEAPKNQNSEFGDLKPWDIPSKGHAACGAWEPSNLGGSKNDFLRNVSIQQVHHLRTVFNTAHHLWEKKHVKMARKSDLYIYNYKNINECFWFRLKHVSKPLYFAHWALARNVLYMYTLLHTYQITSVCLLRIP